MRYIINISGSIRIKFDRVASHCGKPCLPSLYFTQTPNAGPKRLQPGCRRDLSVDGGSHEKASDYDTGDSKLCPRCPTRGRIAGDCQLGPGCRNRRCRGRRGKQRHLLRGRNCRPAAAGGAGRAPFDQYQSNGCDLGRAFGAVSCSGIMRSARSLMYGYLNRCPEPHTPGLPVGAEA